MTKRLLFLSLLLCSTLAGPSTAYAHTVLINSDPIANSTVTSLPEQIKLTFADPLLVLGSRTINEVQVVNPKGEIITSGDNVVKGAILTNVLTPKALDEGLFRVSFRVVAQDGHVITGSFNFSVGGLPKSPTLPGPIPTGVYHLTALANGSGMMGEKGSTSQSARVAIDLDFSRKQVCYVVVTKISDVLAIHVHSMNQQNMSISDEIFLPLDLSSLNSKRPICQAASLTTLSSLYNSANHYMVMFHTKAFPNGAIAGQLVPASQPSNDHGITLKNATLTSASNGGSTVLVLAFTNNQSNTVLLTGISSPIANSGEIFFDANLCQGNNVMTQLRNISVSPGHTELLGYKYQGGVLTGLLKKLSIGDSIPVVVHWLDSKGLARTSVTEASVVQPPKGLYLGANAMTAMPGMTH